MIDPKAFILANERRLHNGQRVRTRQGPGVIDFIWFGCEEMAEVNLDDGTRHCCGLEMDGVYPEETGTDGDPNYNLRYGCSVKETKMDRNLKLNYDALEGKAVAKPRPIGVGDVLKHQEGNHYLVSMCGFRKLILANLNEGGHYGDGMTVSNIHSLSCDEARLLCADNWTCFRLVGRAKDVLSIKDPGE